MRSPTCIFCQIIEKQRPASVVYEDERYLAFMDIYPWRPGHVLIIPKVHHQRLRQLTPQWAQGLFALAHRISDGVRHGNPSCDDVHFLINDGNAANQTVPHIHLHIIPRRRGDLWRLALALCARPIVPLLPPRSRRVLDREAAEIQRHIPD